jgi:hypothetical protein
MVAINAAWELLRDPAARGVRRSRAATRSGGGRRSARARRTSRPDDPPPARDVPAPGDRGRQAPPARRHRREPAPETVSRDWTSGRSGSGGGYDASTMRGRRVMGPRARRPATRREPC